MKKHVLKFIVTRDDFSFDFFPKKNFDENLNEKNGRRCSYF